MKNLILAAMSSMLFASFNSSAEYLSKQGGVEFAAYDTSTNRIAISGNLHSVCARPALQMTADPADSTTLIVKVLYLQKQSTCITQFVQRPYDFVENLGDLVDANEIPISRNSIYTVRVEDYPLEIEVSGEVLSL